jgi:hypothetical protein
MIREMTGYKTPELLSPKARQEQIGSVQPNPGSTAAPEGKGTWVD